MTIKPSEHWILPDWPAPNTVQAVSTTRMGGLSQGAYQGLNLGLHVGDVKARVEANRFWLHTQLSVDAIQWLDQVHGLDCIQASAPIKDVITADALWTDQASIACAVMTADCLPILLCNDQGTRVCAVHAGWRGLAAGIIYQALDCFDKSDQVLAWFGPAIGPNAFEVSDDVRKAFCRSMGVQAEAAFKPLAKNDGNESECLGQYLCDLYQLARWQLEQNPGVMGVFGGDHCTLSEPDCWFSHRREQPTGRMASLIWITP